MNTWILVADSTEAKIFSSTDLHLVKELTFVKEFKHEASRKKDSDLVSDRPGHYQASSSHGSFGEKHEARQLEVDNFAAKLAHELKTAWDLHEYKKLVLVAPAHFYGYMQKHLDKHVISASKMEHVIKDYTKYTTLHLAQSLKEHFFVV
jgi:protein required for attachment to host cells